MSDKAIWWVKGVFYPTKKVAVVYGEPRVDLLDAHKILQDRVIAIHGSNPHKTDLY